MASSIRESLNDIWEFFKGSATSDTLATKASSVTKKSNFFTIPFFADSTNFPNKGPVAFASPSQPFTPSLEAIYAYQKQKVATEESLKTALVPAKAIATDSEMVTYHEGTMVAKKANLVLALRQTYKFAAKQLKSNRSEISCPAAEMRLRSLLMFGLNQDYLAKKFMMGKKLGILEDINPGELMDDLVITEKNLEFAQALNEIIKITARNAPQAPIFSMLTGLATVGHTLEPFKILLRRLFGGNVYNSSEEARKDIEAVIVNPTFREKYMSFIEAVIKGMDKNDTFFVLLYLNWELKKSFKDETQAGFFVSSTGKMHSVTVMRRECETPVHIGKDFIAVKMQYETQHKTEVSENYSYLFIPNDPKDIEKFTEERVAALLESGLEFTNRLVTLELPMMTVKKKRDILEELGVPVDTQYLNIGNETVIKKAEVYYLWIDKQKGSEAAVMAVATVGTGYAGSFSENTEEPMFISATTPYVRVMTSEFVRDNKSYRSGKLFAKIDDNEFLHKDADLSKMRILKDVEEVLKEDINVQMIVKIVAEKFNITNPKSIEFFKAQIPPNTLLSCFNVINYSQNQEVEIKPNGQLLLNKRPVFEDRGSHLNFLPDHCDIAVWDDTNFVYLFAKSPKGPIIGCYAAIDKKTYHTEFLRFDISQTEIKKILEVETSF